MTHTAGLQALRRLWADRGGNVAIIFGLAIIPVFGLIGMAVDYNRAANVRTSLQAATDSTALMLSREAVGLSQADLDAKAADYFKSNFLRSDAAPPTVTAKLTSLGPGAWQLDVNVTTEVSTTISRALDLTNYKLPQKMELAAKSSVKWGMKTLEVALALDNTGSMSWSGKMTELKKAVKTLLDTLKAAEKQPGDIKVAIIPFDTTVNIGTGFKNKDWFDYDNLDCNGWKKGNGCTKSNWKDYWEGCVRDRTRPYDVQDDPPTSKDTKYPVHECGSLAEALPLTSDWTKLKNKVDQMTPNGYTNVTIGLIWAVHALTTQEPYTQAAAPKPDLEKVIILLTDGLNTEAWNNAKNQTVKVESELNDRTRKACQTAKNANIKLYTVRVIEGDADLLRDCATNPGMYYDVQQASDLNAVFKAIANSLARLYIAK